MPIVPIGDEKLEKVPIWIRETRDLERQTKRSEQAAIARVRNAVRTASKGRRGTKAQRQRTRLEHLFAEAKDHHGLARAQWPRAGASRSATAVDCGCSKSQASDGKQGTAKRSKYGHYYAIDDRFEPSWRPATPPGAQTQPITA